MRLLVIEDEARLVEVLKSALERAGFVVDAVDTAADAREALALVAYDAAILDLGLPDGDGLGSPRRSASCRQKTFRACSYRARRGGGSRARPRCRCR